MKQIKRSQCQILTLIMKGKWYDMVASGEKKEEYREFKHYYEIRVHNWMQRLDYEGGFAIIEMRRGYQKNAPKMWFPSMNTQKDFRQHYDIRTKAKHPEWGEPNGIEHYAFILGDRVEVV